MSTTIDSRVVEMRFDNKHFESNVSTTMSTLDKLKQKLNLDGATKGLENVDAATKKVNMSGLGTAVETVQAKFSALQVVGVTALANITNSAVNAGKQIVKSLTIDPVKTGFSEYELKMGSIQTIMAGTGESLDTVNRYLNELNKYSDDTIYSFKDMTSNIGKFTNAGVKLEDAVLAIKGISNEAAISGANANEASRAMYNFSQALSAGFVKLVDWKSIELANMATKEFKEQLIQTAVEVGTLKEGADGMYDVVNVISKANAVSLNATKNFNDSLGNQWMTTEVLINTLRKYADETTDIGQRATAAATEVKTFTMMMDTLKESAQSGWAQTWELLVGDFEEAKAFFTELSGIFGEILSKSADRRNNLLGGALTSNWDKLITKLGEAGIAADDFKESIREAVGGDKFDEIIDEFGSLDKAVKAGAISSDILKKVLDGIAGTAADSTITKFVEGIKEIDRTLRFGSTGDDVKKLQTALKELGYELGNFGENGDGIDGVIGSVTEDAIRAFQEANGLVVDGIAGPQTLAALEKVGGKLGDITGDVDELKSSCGELIDVITKDSGRELLLDSLMNVIKAIQRPLQAVGEALRNTFSLTPDQLYKGLEKLNKFTKRFVPKGVLDAKTWDVLTDRVNKLGITTSEFELKIKEVLSDNGVDVDALIEKYGSLGKAFEKGAISFDYIKKALLGFDGITESLITGGETLDKIRRSFEGLFAIIDIISTVLAGPIKLAFKVVTKVLERLGLTVLDITANIGDAIVKFRDKIDKVIDVITDFIVNNVSEWVKKFKETAFFKTCAGWFEDASKAIRGALDDISNRVDNFNVTGFGKRLKTFADVFSKVINSIKNSKAVTAIIDGITRAFGKLKEFFGKFKLPEFNLDNLKTFVTNLVKIGEKIGGSGKKGVLGAVTGFGEHLKDNVISWDWTVFKEAALEKFVNFWLKSGDLIKKAFEKAKEVGIAIKKFLFGTEEVNLPVIMDAITKFLWIVTLIKTIKLLDTVVSPFDNISNALNNFASSLKWEAISGAFKSLALALGVLTICIIVLTQMPDMKKAWSAAGILISLIVVLGAVVTIMGLVAGKAKSGLNLAGATMSLLMLVGSIALLIHALKEIDGLKLNDPSKTVFTLIGVLVGLTIAVRAISKAGGASFRSVASILTLVASLKMILDVITAYDEFDWSGKRKAIDKMVQMMLALALAIRIMSGGVKEGASANGVAFAIIAMVIALKVMLNSIDDIASKSPEDLKKGIAVIGILMGIMTAMMVVVNLTSKGGKLKKGEKSINNFTGIAMALIAVVAAIWLLGKMDINTLAQGGLAVAGILILFTGMLAVLGKSCKGLKIGSIFSMLIMIAVLMAEMAIIIKIMQDVPWQSSISTAGALAGMLLAIGFVLRSLRKINVKGIKLAKLLGVLAGIGILIGALALILYGMKDVSGPNAVANTVALAALLAAMTGVLHSLAGLDMRKYSAAKLKKVAGMFAGLTVILALLGAVLWGMSALGVTDALTNATALSELLIVLTGVIFVLSKLKITGNITPAILAIAALGLVVLELGAVLALVKQMNISGMESELLILSALLIVLTGVMAVCAAMGSVAGANMVGMAVTVAAIAVLGAVVLELGYFLSIIKSFAIGSMMPEVIVLSTLLLVLTGVMAACTALGIIATAGWVGLVATVAAIAVLGAVVLELGYFLSLIKQWDIGGMMPEVTVLSTLLLNLTVVLGLLTIIGMGAPAAIAGVVALTTMITVLGLLVIAIGALITEFPQLQTFVDTGIALLIQLADGLGTMIGKFVSAIAGEIMSILPQLGLCLSQFMTNATPFIMGAKMVDEKVLAGVGILAGAVLALTAADLLTGVVSWLQGGSSFADLGTQLSMFMANAMPFITAAAAISPDMLTGVKALAETILILTAANVLEGLTSWLTGGSSLENFGAQLPVLGHGLAAFSSSLGAFTEEQLATVNCAAQAVKTLASAAAEIPNTGGLLASIVGDNDLGTFAAQFPILGTGLRGFLDNVGVFTEEQVATVNCAAQAVKTLAAAASEIPNVGGLLASIVGDNDLGTFASQFPVLGTGLRGFLDNVGVFTEEQVATVDCAAQAIKSLASAASEIPNSGGWVGAIVGENDLETFANQFPSLGTGLAGFLSNVGTFTSEQVTTVSCAANAVKSLAMVAATIPNEGGWISKIVGDNDLTTFASHFPKLGEGLAGFVSNIGVFTEAQVSSVNAAVRAIQALSGLANANLQGAKKHLDGFGDKLPNLARDVASFCTNMPNNASATAAISNLNQILSAVKNIANVNSGSMATFADNLKKVGTNAVSKFVEAFTSASAKTNVSDAAKKLGDQVVKGVEAKEKSVESAAKKVADKAVAGVKDKHSGMKSAGKYLVEGFGNGITEQTWYAEAKAKAMANAAEKAAKNALKINSPSKVFRAIGYSVPEGLAAGIDKMSGMVTDSSTGMAKTAIDNVRNSISRISSLASVDIDSQPTIRPVLDLSDVRSGVGLLGNMLDMDSQVGVMSNVGTISSMMNNRQNGASNDDVVSAINKLNKKMDNIGNTTYSINGVTYDDGSNITDAVRTIVHAAQVGRRV